MGMEWEEATKNEPEEANQPQTEMIVLCLNDYPIGVYSSEEEVHQALTKAREEVSRQAQQQSERNKDIYIQCRHFWSRTFRINAPSINL